MLRTGGKQISLLPSKRARRRMWECRLVSLHLGPREVREQIIMEPIYKHMKDKKVLTGSQHEFMKGK